MPKRYTTVEEQVHFGLDTIDADRTVEVPLRDLLFVYQTLRELIRFFHQPAHCETLQDVEQFVGNSRQGALHLLWECCYEKLYDVWPSDIREGFGEGPFDHPDPPYYYAVPEERQEPPY